MSLSHMNLDFGKQNTQDIPNCNKVLRPTESVGRALCTCTTPTITDCPC